MAHAPTDGHDEHTGHGAHHVFDAATLKKTFGILVGLTLLTVVLALWERGHANVFGLVFDFGQLPVGALSVPIALAIAGTKAYWVASRFMGLKYEKSSNALVFLGSTAFLVVFFTFTYLDFAFRDTFDEISAVTRDDVQAEALAAQAREEAIDARFTAPAFVEDNGADLLGERPGATPAPAAPAPADSAAATDGNQN
jgi:caa(3)-type oxidase subunit IV